MQLEKILEEIDKATDEYGMVDYINDEPMITKKQAKDIIRKHMSGKDTDVPTNDGWIPVEERMPETNKKVDVTFREWMNYSKKYRYGSCNAVYIPKHSVEADNIWTDYENDDCVEYDEKTDTLYAAEGWYETIEHWEDYLHCYINCEVIAWRPLPEPYRPERSEK